MAFLEKINSLNGYSCYDWQVTVCFYVGVHLVNAHLATFNHHFGDHSKVSHALNPKISKVAGSIDKDPFYAYKSFFVIFGICLESDGWTAYNVGEIFRNMRFFQITQITNP